MFIGFKNGRKNDSFVRCICLPQNYYLPINEELSMYCGEYIVYPLQLAKIIKSRIYLSYSMRYVQTYHSWEACAFQIILNLRGNFLTPYTFVCNVK